ncbi:hypothetical protein JM47_00505 [Ureaplasma diversum]|uniref:Lipoprotein n=1 Tax=Ureaplasma diversum TaxID=42094 RepID=A0A0C5RNT8_9BACT|nr:hypothetical protein [Ureaplasma diversum]AJQ45139.1 hypothetical protein JM47_00505 [Ureaplasma diversum]
MSLNRKKKLIISSLGFSFLSAPLLVLTLSSCYKEKNDKKNNLLFSINSDSLFINSNLKDTSYFYDPFSYIYETITNDNKAVVVYNNYDKVRHRTVRDKNHPLGYIKVVGTPLANQQKPLYSLINSVEELNKTISIYKDIFKKNQDRISSSFSNLDFNKNSILMIIDRDWVITDDESFHPVNGYQILSVNLNEKKMTITKSWSNLPIKRKLKNNKWRGPMSNNKIFFVVIDKLNSLNNIEIEQKIVKKAIGEDLENFGPFNVDA